MLFVVLMDETGTNKVIYYSSLLPIKIRYLLRFTRGKKLSIPLKKFPSENNQKVAALLDFYDHMQKQTSFANAPLFTADQLQKKGVLETISMSVTTYGRPSDITDVEALFLQDDLYAYAHIKGSSDPQPLPDILKNVHFGREVIGEIKVKEQVFYNHYRVDRYAEGFNICFGKSLKFTFVYENKKGTLNFTIKGTLSDYIQDTKCIIDILENRELNINGAVFRFDEIEKGNVEKYKQSLLYYTDIRKMLDTLGAKVDLECDSLTDLDQMNIRNFTNALVNGKSIGFSGAKNDTIYGRFKIGNLILLIWAEKINGTEGYILQGFFNDHIIAVFDSEDRNKERPYRITHYAMLSKNDILESANIDYGKITEALAENDTSLVVTDRVTLFMLEMLKAYDEQDKKNSALMDTIERYCEWLFDNTDNSNGIMTLNRLQIIRRKRELDEEEISELQDLRKATPDMAIKCGANILLGNMEAAQECFDEMDESVKAVFIEYPICHFGKLNYKECVY